MLANNKIIISGVIGSEYTFLDFATDLQEALKDNPSSLTISISSPGGYCSDADKICNSIKKLSIPVNTENFGDVCSAATVIYMEGINRKFDTSKGVFLIHSPWATTEGNADELLKVVRELRTQEKKYESIYASVTGFSVDVISEIMSQERPLTAEELVKYNFVTELVEGDAKASFDERNRNYRIAALVNYAMSIENSNNQINKENKIKFRSMKTIMAKLIEAIKNLFLVTKDGVELQIDGDELNPGVKIYVEGVPASGSFELNDGTIITAVDGEVTEVQRVSLEEQQPEEKKDEEVVVVEEPVKEEVVEEKKEEIDYVVEELKTKIEELVEEVTMMKAQLKESEDKLKANEVIMSKIVNMTSTEKVSTKEETKEDVKPSRFGFKK